MYRFSRSIYRSLSPLIDDSKPESAAAHKDLLEACEATVSRLIVDRRYFANPARSLFEQVRWHFAIEDQLFAYAVIERTLGLAVDYLDRMPSEHAAMLGPHHCQALTRQGTPCRRNPQPGRDYCPSHRHLEEALRSDYFAG